MTGGIINNVAARTNEFHHKHMHAQLDWSWHIQPCRLEPSQVAQLLLCPHLDHLAGIAAAVACLEAVVA